MQNGSTIRFTGIDRQYASLSEELLAASNLVYSSGNVLDGPHCEEFERNIAKRTDRKFAVAVNSCSQALLLTYLYYKSETNHFGSVSMPALSFIASAAAPGIVGKTINFIDVDERGLLDINKLNVREDNTSIVSYVNLYGNMIDYNKLKLTTDFFNSHEKITIIEDAAQSFGGSYKGIPSGKLGDVSCLSFDPTKNLPNYGSGGMILTDDINVYRFVLGFRNNGKGAQKQMLGTNSRMSEADCAQMNVKLKYFDGWQERRAKIAKYYSECLHPYVTIPEATPDTVHAWHKYVINTVDQLSLQQHLEDNGIETKIHYAEILPEHRTFALGITDWPIASGLTRTSLSLPIYPELLDSELEHIVSTIQKFYD